MFVIIGWVIVIACVLGGYVLHHGNLMVLWVPTEFLIIGGAAIGSLMGSVSQSQLSRIIKAMIHALTAKPPTKDQFMELLLLLFELTKVGRANLLGLEEHVENPENSEIFKRYPGILHNHHAIEFICDTLKVQISSPLSPYDLEELMDQDIAAMHAEEEVAPTAVNRMSDAFPGLGIVAAVLGVILTMGKLTMGKEVIGQSVASALVGTFIGILLCYGIFQPLAARMTGMVEEEGKMIKIIKICLLAFAKDASPKICVEFARRSIPTEVRPTFKEVDEATANAGKKAA